MDNNPFVTCPYNKAHRVPRSRIQGHIVKCEKNYPALAICPYNATHRVPEVNLRNHVDNCPSKVVLVEDKAETKVIFYKPMPMPISHITRTAHSDDEWWD